VELGHRVRNLRTVAGTWLVDDEPFDAVVLACSAAEAARLSEPVAPRWAAVAAALPYEAIATVYLQRGPAALRCPIVALRSTTKAPAQFALDLDFLGVAARTVAFVVSGARDWVDQGMDRLTAAVQAQALSALPAHFPAASAALLHASVERRATFVCKAGLARPPAEIASGLIAAGDYIAGPLPATLEGAVRSGILAARAVGMGAGSSSSTGLLDNASDLASTMQKSIS
jgi:predicted NAD/FAD-binding protein